MFLKLKILGPAACLHSQSCEPLTETKHLEPVHCEPLKLVMQTVDPHLGPQSRKKGSQEVVKKRRKHERKYLRGTTKTKQNKKTFVFAHSHIQASSVLGVICVITPVRTRPALITFFHPVNQSSPHLCVFKRTRLLFFLGGAR